MIRASRERDLEAIAGILNQYENAPVSLDILRDHHKAARRDQASIQLVEDERGKIVSHGTVLEQHPHRGRKTVLMDIRVHKSFRRLGFGRRMEEALRPFLLSTHPEIIEASVKLTDAYSLGWARRRGFTVAERICESVLDVETYDTSGLKDAIYTARRNGIHIRTMESFGAGPEKWFRLYETLAPTYQDIPGMQDVPIPTYPEWHANTVISTIHPAGVFIALLGGQWVGASIVGQWNNSELYNRYTAAAREFRRLGVASLLKHTTVEYAKRMRIKRIRTNNSSENLPMRAINRKMGYRSVEGFYVMKRGILLEK